MMKISEKISDHARRYETTGRPVFITAIGHRLIPSLDNLVGQVAPQVLPDAYETGVSFPI